MLEVNILKNNRDEVLRKLQMRHFNDLHLVDVIIVAEEKRKKLQFETDERQSTINRLSKETGLLMAKGKKEESESNKAAVANQKKLLQPVQEELENIQNLIFENLSRLPNLPHATVPGGASSKDNVVVQEGGELPVLSSSALPHWDLAKKYDLIDFDLGNKISGAGFPVYRGQGAKLQRALINYFLEYNIAAGYIEHEPPFLVNEVSAFGTGQLPDKEGQMYHTASDDLYLIPTAEVPLTNIYRDEIIKETDLPIKMTAYTPCFRREAGSYGKEVRGLNRIHQFDKVEIVQIVKPNRSYDLLEDMVGHVEKLLQSLELRYRILRLCAGDMGFTSALTYDFEVYSAAQKRWLEVSSVSNFETFQTNRMKIRYKNEKGKTELLHSLNGSSLALPRVVAALLENHQQENHITLPQVLHSYFGKEIIS